MEILLVAHNLLLEILARVCVRVGRRAERAVERVADLLHEGACEAVGVSHLQHAAVQVDLHANLEVVDAVEAAVRLGHAVTLEEDGALALALQVRVRVRVRAGRRCPSASPI